MSSAFIAKVTKSSTEGIYENLFTYNLLPKTYALKIHSKQFSKTHLRV